MKFYAEDFQAMILISERVPNGKGMVEIELTIVLSTELLTNSLHLVKGYWTQQFL
jgi:hypothetical protein